MPSNNARTRCPRPVDNVIPETVAVALDCHHGAASPASAGTHITPSLSVADTASSCSAPVTMPSEANQRTAEAAV